MKNISNRKNAVLADFMFLIRDRDRERREDFYPSST
jgi:hypothetical protein